MSCWASLNSTSAAALSAAVGWARARALAVEISRATPIAASVVLDRSLPAAEIIRILLGLLGHRARARARQLADDELALDSSARRRRRRRGRDLRAGHHHRWRAGRRRCFPGEGCVRRGGPRDV